MANVSKSMSARLRHIKRRLKRDESLTGKHLELALEVWPCPILPDRLVNLTSHCFELHRADIA